LQKTNQFNLTTRRHTEADLRALIEAHAQIYLASLCDRFGDYGRIALAIAVPAEDGAAQLDTFLMSCRAIGRKAESVFLAEVASKLRQRGFSRLRAEFLPTAKNQVSAGFLADHGFQAISDSTDPDDRVGAYEIDLANILEGARRFYQVETR
jgi:FkbH-like protein